MTLGFAVVLVCGIYPGILWVIGQTAFRFQANGSIVDGPDGKPVGSLLIAQPFTKDEYFQSRPSAVSYDASASGSSTLGAANYAPFAGLVGEPLVNVLEINLELRHRYGPPA
ncbi:potassium-transporting ATPase subunit C [Paraburkholderia sp. BR14374]|uniref:potassium-transporting ATPase subunit C n=1 Tax=Paraburkholderia sp. BR14374 TaxID=3237007 RepID=UPI0034CD3AB6